MPRRPATFRPFQFLVDVQVYFGLRYLIWLVDFHRRTHRRLDRGWRKFRGSLQALLRPWLLTKGLAVEVVWRRRGVSPHNRTPTHIEEQIVRLYIAHPWLGAGQLGQLAERVLGVRLVRKTIRLILRRRGDLAAVLTTERRKKPSRIVVKRPLQLWGIDHTLVFVLGFFPVWLLGVVDYHGSRVIFLKRCRPTTAAVRAALQRAFQEHGTPARILSDNGPAFTSLDFALFLANSNVDHTRTKPRHPWTNGRIERLFRTFKDTVFAHLWLFVSRRQIDRYCVDFKQFYNRDRPHSSYGGRTPNEVFFGVKRKAKPRGRVSYFDGTLSWYRFG
jgi:transposase InsO family protein